MTLRVKHLLSEHKDQIPSRQVKPGLAAHTCNPSTRHWETETGGFQECAGQSADQAKTVNTMICKKLCLKN